MGHRGSWRSHVGYSSAIVAVYILPESSTPEGAYSNIDPLGQMNRANAKHRQREHPSRI